MRPNKYAGRCGCGTFVTPGQGTIDKISGRWVVFCATCRVPSYAGAAPTPAARPVVRSTLVAPIFPLPAARTSPPVFSLTSRYPKGIAPSRYAIAIANKGIMVSGT